MSFPHMGPITQHGSLARLFRHLCTASCLLTPMAQAMPLKPPPSFVGLQQSLWSEVAERHGLDPCLLYAVALVESSRIEKGEAAPWPWAIHHRGRALYPDSRAEALAYLRHQILAGERTLDVGLMQVNLRWHGHRVARLEHLMEPKTNLELGARILAESIASVPGDPILGVGRYHAWQDREEALRYGRKVLRIADALKTLTNTDQKERP